MYSPLFRGICVIGILLGAASCNLDREKERKAAEIAALEAEAKKAEEEKQKIEAQAKEQQKKIDALLGELANAKDEATRLEIQKQLDEVAGKGKTKARPATTAKPCNCAKDDPLCSCL